MPPIITHSVNRTVDARVRVVEEIVHIKKPIFNDVAVERPVPVDKEYERPVIKNREVIVDVVTPRIVYKDVVVDRPIFKDIVVERITYKDVVIERPVYVDKTMFIPQVTIREELRIVPKTIEKEEIRYKFVDRIVEVPVYKPVHIDKAIIKNMEYICPQCDGPGRRK
jgi:hypothetical protein